MVILSWFLKCWYEYILSSSILVHNIHFYSYSGLCSFLVSLSFLLSFVISVSIMGVIIVSCPIFRYYDIKKIIAFPSILHSNLTLVSIYSVSSIGSSSGMITSISHASSSISSFQVIGLLVNKTYTRYLDSVFSVDLYTRGSFLSLLPSNISFPGSYNFTGEILGSISYWFISTGICFGSLVSAFLSFLNRFLILNRKLPYHSCSNSLN